MSHQKRHAQALSAEAQAKPHVGQTSSYFYVGIDRRHVLFFVFPRLTSCMVMARLGLLLISFGTTPTGRTRSEIDAPCSYEALHHQARRKMKKQHEISKRLSRSVPQQSEPSFNRVLRVYADIRGQQADQVLYVEGWEMTKISMKIEIFRKIMRRYATLC